jgi:hypothetical protein
MLSAGISGGEVLLAPIHQRGRGGAVPAAQRCSGPAGKGSGKLSQMIIALSRLRYLRRAKSLGFSDENQLRLVAF